MFDFYFNNFVEEDSEKKEGEEAEEEEPKVLSLDDTELWKNMDLDRDGKITVEEYHRFEKSFFTKKICCFTNTRRYEKCS